jgi:signal transduction histidine kinase
MTTRAAITGTHLRRRLLLRQPAVKLKWGKLMFAPFFCNLGARTLRNLSLIWILPLLCLTACHQSVPTKPVDEWADYRKAYTFLSNNKDSAFYYFNRAATGTTNKEQIATAYQNMALIQSDAGDHYGAQESLTSALKALDKQDPKNRTHLAEDYNQMGMTFSNLKDYQQALKYYDLALHYADSPALKLYFLNNQGNAYKDLKTYAKALSSYIAVIRIVGTQGTDYARTLNNLATTKWLQNPRYDAAPELGRSLAIRLGAQDVWGENSSYGHLADFYMDSRPDSALWYARKLLGTASQLKSADDELAALRKLIVLVPQQSKVYFQQYQRLEDSVQTKRSAQKSQFAVIRYNVEQAKDENLQLQKKSTERRYQLLAVLAAFLFAVAWAIWWYRKRRQRLQLLAEQEIQENKLRLSQKVHDQVANGIYRIISEVEHTDMDKTRLLDQLDQAYEISRNIAHEDPETNGDFTEQMRMLLNGFKNPSVKLAVTGNEPLLWDAVDLTIRKQLKLVLQELMVNMSKHSRATRSRVGFNLANGCLEVDYWDNGVGLSDQAKQGRGLGNTVSRIEALQGSIKFESPNEKGLRIEIRVPLAK